MGTLPIAEARNLHTLTATAEKTISPPCDTKYKNFINEYKGKVKKIIIIAEYNAKFLVQSLGPLCMNRFFL